MWPTRQAIATRLEADLAQFSTNQHALPGIADPAARATLAMQMVASLRRLDYSDIIRTREINPNRADPKNPSFDPERAAVVHMRAGRNDEAFWLVFLITHFGKHLAHGWQRLREVYSGLGGHAWTWARVSADPASFRAWLLAHRDQIGGGFGSHRKRESVRADLVGGTAAVIESYVTWVGPTHSHAVMMAKLTQAGGNSPESVFDHCYRSMNVARFGRLGRFDYLCLLRRLGFANISPGRAYLKGATGPLSGARLLFGGAVNAAIGWASLEDWILELDAVLGVGMQVMEDLLCNWQKSPSQFVHFRG